MKILKKNWILILATLAAVALVLFNLPGLKAWRLRALAAEQIKSYVDLLESSSPDSTEGFFYCLLPLFHEGSQPLTALNHATQWLEQAQRLDPKNSHGNFLLGQAYCLQREYGQAISAFEGYLAQRPENLLAKAEAGFAYAALAQSVPDPQIAQTNQSKSLQLLEDVGYSASSFINLGDAAFTQERYQEAVAWYEVIESFSELEILKLFRNEMLLELDGDLTIEPTKFFIFSSGSFVQTRVEADRTAGILYNNSQIASILLDVNKANKYCITLNALDYPPQPTKIGIVIDYMNHSMLELENGDGSWVQFDFTVFLEKGIHVLGIKLINDTYVKGEIDRNAYFGSMTIELCQGGYVP